MMCPFRPVLFCDLFLAQPGAGKTAFSKALFCVSLGRLWEAKIIPSRVEYSKINYDVDEEGPDQRFFNYVRRCQLRDLLIFFIYAPDFDESDQLQILSNLKLNMPELERNLRSAIQGSAGESIDGETLTISQQVQIGMEKIYEYLDPSQQADLLYALTEALDISFLISFDGFDAVHIDDFFFEDGMTSPAVEHITFLMRKLWNRQAGVGLHLKPVRAHYLVYLRDTTFERLRTSLIKDVGGPSDLPINWIVPPKYEQLVQNAAVMITGNANPAQNKSNLFVKDTFRAFNAAIFDSIDGLTAQTHLSFVFASNARRMKRHIVRSLIWALHRSSQIGTVDFLRRSAGVNAAWLWSELITSQSISKVPQYLTLEELYLNESRQLVPTLNVEYPYLSKVLEDEDFKSALDHIQDRDEIVATYGCVLNYFLPRKMKSPAIDCELPQLLILIRMIQFVGVNHRCVLSQVVSFVRSLGYNLNDKEARFCMYLLIRNQLVMWDSSTGAQSIDTSPLYVTTKGRILVERLVFTVTYASEAMLDSLHCDSKLNKLLIRRVFDNPLNWVVDCLHNASLFCHIIEQIEAIEIVNARASKISLDEYMLGAKVRSTLFQESRAILNFCNTQALERHMENLERLKDARAIYPLLKPLGMAS